MEHTQNQCHPERAPAHVAMLLLPLNIYSKHLQEVGLFYTNTKPVKCQSCVKSLQRNDFGDKVLGVLFGSVFKLFIICFLVESQMWRLIDLSHLYLATSYLSTKLGNRGMQLAWSCLKITKSTYQHSQGLLINTYYNTGLINTKIQTQQKQIGIFKTIMCWIGSSVGDAEIKGPAIQVHTLTDGFNLFI